MLLEVIQARFEDRAAAWEMDFAQDGTCIHRHVTTNAACIG